MALSRLKTWISEVLTAADLNAEFDNIINNATSLISPLTGALDADGKEIILDADADTSITADTDDQIDFKVGGSDLYRMTSSGFSTLSSATITSAGALTVTAGNITATAGNITATAGDVNLTAGALNTARATVASAATTADIWGANGNQIDWTGTTTCTGFPAAPQAGAERVLICAAAAPFTAGANMLIDGVTSGNTVTCAANDIVIVRAVTTTQFRLSRVKYDGTAQSNPVATATVAGLVPTPPNNTTTFLRGDATFATPAGSPAGDHEIVVHTGNGMGSTNTRIRRFTTAMTTIGTAITYADSADLGGTFTINSAGLYAITYMDKAASGGTFGVTLNSAELATNIQSVDIASRVMMVEVPHDVSSATAYVMSCSAIIKCAVNDVIRAHCDGDINDTTNRVMFRIRKIANIV